MTWKSSSTRKGTPGKHKAGMPQHINTVQEQTRWGMKKSKERCRAMRRARNAGPGPTRTGEGPLRTCATRILISAAARALKRTAMKGPIPLQARALGTVSTCILMQGTMCGRRRLWIRGIILCMVARPGSTIAAVTATIRWVWLASGQPGSRTTWIRERTSRFPLPLRCSLHPRSSPSRPHPMLTPSSGTNSKMRLHFDNSNSN